MNYPDLQQDIAQLFEEAQITHRLDLRKGAGFHIYRSKKAARTKDPRAQPFTDQHGRLYNCLSEAVERLGVNRGLAFKVLRGERKQTKGFTFRYVQRA